ncbi:MAG: ribonuclease Y [Candidatus Latescibacteria bacterium]|jgi:ribonucrease Y|nr:ribonuclease Y [Candidatus Latescibacterota bacterium]MBT4139499.1 ribonuclease Y [Candidatus Latescibacterota bacterium]MBT5830480.1 ribonuclease Y [Candidatus Latescibacterota bacterium]
MDALLQGAPQILVEYGLWVAIVGVFLFFALGWFLCAWFNAQKIKDIEQQTEKRVAKLAEKADRDRKAAFLEEKNKWYDNKARFERELDQKQRELEELGDKQQEQEGKLTERLDLAQQRDKDLGRRERDVRQRGARLEKREAELDDILVQQRSQLERISGMNADHAREMLLETIKHDLKQTATNIGREIIDQARERADREAKKILSLAIERCSTDQTVQSSISVVALPDDDIKGRIVGKEGRNIISFEAATGVKVIVNDTPEAVVLSSFDPVKRDVARLAMEQLVREGRINPSRVEEVVADCEQKIEGLIVDEGKQAVRELNIDDLHPELIKLVGKLKYRTSYGQSVLGHSKEVAFLAGAMAAEVGLDEKLARRCALLHDLGKAVDQEQEGKHTDIGAFLVGKYGEGDEVINGIFYHHGEAEATTPISFLVKAADAISSSRPGARRDDAEGYIKRVRDLEEVAQAFDGVRDAYAINAGREVRVMVNAGRVNDDQAKTLSFEIAQRIRDEMTYPGEVQITVIRQTIATDWAGRSNKRRPKNKPRGRGGRRFDRNRGRNNNDRKNGSYRREGQGNSAADKPAGEQVQQSDRGASANSPDNR